jgi:hypothetical protein
VSQSDIAALDIGNVIPILAFVVIPVTGAAEIGNWLASGRTVPDDG